MQVGLTARPGLYVNDQSNACKGSIWNPVEFSRDICKYGICHRQYRKFCRFCLTFKATRLSVSGGGASPPDALTTGSLPLDPAEIDSAPSLQFRLALALSPWASHCHIASDAPQPLPTRLPQQ